MCGYGGSSGINVVSVIMDKVSAALLLVDQLYPWVAGPLGCTEEQHVKLL